MTDINNLDRAVGRPNWTLIISLGVAALGIIFGIQQCRNNSITQGDLEARADSVAYWKDQAGTEHAKVGQLVTSQAFVQQQLDSLKKIPGAKVVATTTIVQKGQEVLKPIEGGLPPGMAWVKVGENLWVLKDTAHALVPDTATYLLTARDTLDWLQHTVRTYSSKWDTVKVTFDSATLVVNDKLHVSEYRVKEGGLFNRKVVPYVDVYHENPMLKTGDVKAWRVSTPVKHWVIGPAANFYPKWNNGIKFGASFGISVVYAGITF